MGTYSYGHDFGNAETCGVALVGNRRVSKCIPTAIAPGSSTKLERLGHEYGMDDFVFQWESENIESYIGDLAIRQARMSFNGRGDISRYCSKNSLTTLLTVAASLIDESDFSLNVVTGLPVQTYVGDGELRRKIKTALDGTHRFSLNRRQRTVKVNVVRTIMEGAGAAIAYGSREDQIFGVVDIGGRTTDLFASKGQKMQESLCHGKPVGVLSAGKLLQDNFEKKYGFSLPDCDMNDILRASLGSLEYPVITNCGTRVLDIPFLVQEALQSVGNEIVSFVSDKWSSSEAGSRVASNFRNVLCIGGGAHYFLKQLQERIPHLVSVDRPEEANAYGYCLFAEQLSRQKCAV